jgi:FMN-dependent NADH-azoreductase
MTNILHISCSPRGRAAESYRLSQKIVDLLVREQPAATITSRNLADSTGGAMPHVDQDYAVSQQSAADISQHGSMALSERLIQELESADVVVIGTPMHNFTVPSILKAWIDHIVRVRRTFDIGPNGKIALLRDRPVFIGIASGGRFSGDRTRQPDFLTPYLKAVLGIVGLHDLTFFSVEGTGSGADVLIERQTSVDLALEEYFSRRGAHPAFAG